MVGIEGSLIGPDLGLVPGAIGLSQMRAGELAPQVVWNGRNYVVSWIDERGLFRPRDAASSSHQPAW